MTVSNGHPGTSYATDDAPAATVLVQAAERSHREGRTVRLKRETKDGEVFYEEAD